MRVLLFILIASHVQEFSAQSSSAKGETYRNYFNPYFNSYPHIPTEIIDVGENGLPLTRSGAEQYVNNYASLPRLGEPLNLDGAKQVSQVMQGGQQYYPYPYNAGFPFNGYYNIPGTNPGAGTANVQYPNYYQGFPGNIYGTNQYFAGNHLPPPPPPPPKFPSYTITETKKKYQSSNAEGRKRVVTSTVETSPVQTKISRYIDGRTGELKVDILSSGNGKSAVVVEGDGVDDVLPSRETTTEELTTTQEVNNDVNNTKPDDVFSWFA